MNDFYIYLAICIFFLIFFYIASCIELAGRYSRLKIHFYTPKYHRLYTLFLLFQLFPAKQFYDDYFNHASNYILTRKRNSPTKLNPNIVNYTYHYSTYKDLAIAIASDYWISYDIYTLNMYKIDSVKADINFCLLHIDDIDAKDKLKIKLESIIRLENRFA